MSDWVNDRIPTPAAHHPAWRFVVPVKGGPAAKTRLRAPDGVDHPTLAMALALDTVEAAIVAVGPQHVVVVTADPDVARALRAKGVTVVPDPGGGLNAAVAAGIAGVEAVTGAGAAAPAVAVLLGDVPAVRADDLRRALRAADEYAAAFVPDAEGTGTVLLTTHPDTAGGAVQPRFGPGSAGAHEDAGLVRLDLDLPALRRDVDDIESLQAALELGVGAHTARVLAHLVGPAALVGLDP